MYFLPLEGLARADPRGAFCAAPQSNPTRDLVFGNMRYKRAAELRVDDMRDDDDALRDDDDAFCGGVVAKWFTPKVQRKWWKL